jgi:hypothetical protein
LGVIVAGNVRRHRELVLRSTFPAIITPNVRRRRSPAA